MTSQPDQYPRIALENYAKKRLAAENYPHSNHHFKPYVCPTCGLTAFKLFIEYHSGSTSKNFRGVIRGSCSLCGSEQELFSFTGRHRQKIQVTTIECPCGSEFLYAGECERVEDSDGIPGFVDEGIAVGACSRCGRLTTIVEWD